MVGVVGRGQDLRLVNEVDAEGLQDLGLNEVANTGLRHHRDGDCLNDAVNHVGIRHAGDATLGTNIGGDALKGHHGGGAGIFSDLGLLRGHHVHDDAAFEHFS